MRNIVFCAGVRLGRFTTGCRLHSTRAGSKKITSYLRDLSSVTKDPIWRIVQELHSPQRFSLPEALRTTRVSLDDFSRWQTSLYASDLDKALENSPNPSLSTLPSWLVLYLASYKVRTPQHASGSLMDLSFAHLDVAPATIGAPLLVITMIHLARFDLLPSMQRVIDAFLRVPIKQFRGVHYNHLLAAMTSIRHRSQQTGDNAVRILRAMEARQVPLWTPTCSALLEDRYTTLQLTTFLRRRMTKLGVVPTVSQLESYLRVYAADGAIHDAEQYAAAIRELRPPRNERLSAEEQASAKANRHNRANLHLVRGQPDSASAFEFLFQLAAKSTSVPRRPTTHPRNLLGKRHVDVYDWSAALSVSVKDFSVNARSLIRLFMRARPKTADFHATAATYTIIIRGLLLRREWELAYLYWIKLARSGLPIDGPALAAGLQATTLSRRPAEGFTLLELYAARADVKLPSAFRLRRPLTVTTGIINMFMISLHRILRPDLVFRLWDSMEELYNVRPSAETLRIMLETAQLPHTLDDSFTGQLALLASKNPFRHQLAPPTTRAALIESLTAQAAAPYRAGLWRAQPATVTAARIFIQAALGSPNHLHIAALDPPAYAVRAHTESDSAAPTLRLDMAPAPFALPADILTPAGGAHFPELCLRERDWAAYIMLLGMTRRAPEIARALVWMRALGVRPSERLLGVALAFWGEVSVQPPLVAAMAGRDGDQYMRLVKWLREWCDKVPDEHGVGEMRVWISRVKVQRRRAIEAGRLVDEEQIWTM
ncbi:hypothetical protein DFH06DRAFT_1224708 [Mycena polygramma]|nr:hypothetical protein DFH06DRAFT_1224708 [Mycena polygramma]